jgi:hypothetical protein
MVLDLSVAQAGCGRTSRPTSRWAPAIDDHTVLAIDGLVVTFVAAVVQD